MPELPEVEAVRTQLAATLQGRRLDRLSILHSDVWNSSASCEDPAVLNNGVLSSVDRRGKYLILNFTPEYNLIIHLRMTGQLLIKEAEAELEPHTHASFSFGSTRLDFRDVRRFGRLELSRHNEDWASKLTIAELGPEPLSDSFTVSWLRGKAKRHQRLNSKAFLLNQKVIAGLGNIYADEILHRSKIHPARPVRHLKTADLTRIHDAAREIIQASIALGGTSFSDYLHTDGSRGDYLSVAAVYGRGGKPCRSCGTELIKTRIAGRGTVYCPFCQKPPRGFKP